MDKSSPLVSVVINSFNQASFLEQTIQSVLDQDYPNLEVILVDGGSTDGSLEIIQRYSDRFKWWVSEKDNGQADGINKGFLHSQGEIVAWLNSDDYYLPDAITRAVASTLFQPDAVLFYGDVVSVDENGSIINRMKTGEWQVDDLMTFHILNQPAVFMRHEPLKQAGYLDQQFHYLLDHHLWLRIAVQGKMIHIPEVLAAGRFHSAAKNVSSAVHFGEEAYRLVAWMKEFPATSDMALSNMKRMEAGAHRINGRYLLDGGKPWASIQSYWKGLITDPATILPELHRMFYAFLSLLGLGVLKRYFFSIRRLVRRVKMD